MTPDDIAKQKIIDPDGAAKTEREHMQHGSYERRPSWILSAVMIAFIVPGVWGMVELAITFFRGLLR